MERTNGVLQDRLVKMLKLEGITDMQAGNAYLRDTLGPAYNAKFAVAPMRQDDAHRPAPSPGELDAALSLHHQRAVSADGTVPWQGRCMQLQAKDAQPRRGMKVTVREHLDGRIELRATDDRPLAYQTLDERHLRPKPPAPPTPPATQPTPRQHLAPHAPPPKPAAHHPWRQSFAGTGACPDHRNRVACHALYAREPRNFSTALPRSVSSTLALVP